MTSIRRPISALFPRGCRITRPGASQSFHPGTGSPSLPIWLHWLRLGAGSRRECGHAGIRPPSRRSQWHLQIFEPSGTKTELGSRRISAENHSSKCFRSKGCPTTAGLPSLRGQDTPIAASDIRDRCCPRLTAPQHCLNRRRLPSGTHGRVRNGRPSSSVARARRNAGRRASNRAARRNDGTASPIERR